MLEQFSVKKYEPDGFWYISPMSPEDTGKYTIQCDSEEEGWGIVQKIISKALPDPVNAATGTYDKIEEYLSSSQGRYTPCYRLKS